MCREGGKESASHFEVHLAVTSVGHGVFKGVVKCRKIPEEEREGKNGGSSRAARRLSG
jgi:hypothetical protein